MTPEPEPEPCFLAEAKQIARKYHVPGMAREDVEQEAVLAAIVARKVWDMLPPPRKPLRKYLHAAVRRHLSNLVRASQRKPALEQLPPDHPGPVDPGRGPEARSEDEDLREAIWAQLPPRQAAAVAGTYIDGSGDSEIAARFGLRPHSVGRYRRRGLRRFRKGIAQIPA